MKKAIVSLLLLLLLQTCLTAQLEVPNPHTTKEKINVGLHWVPTSLLMSHSVIRFGGEVGIGRFGVVLDYGLGMDKIGWARGKYSYDYKALRPQLRYYIPLSDRGAYPRQELFAGLELAHVEYKRDMRDYVLRIDDEIADIARGTQYTKQISVLAKAGVRFKPTAHVSIDLFVGVGRGQRDIAYLNQSRPVFRSYPYLGIAGGIAQLLRKAAIQTELDEGRSQALTMDAGIRLQMVLFSYKE